MRIKKRVKKRTHLIAPKHIQYICNQLVLYRFIFLTGSGGVGKSYTVNWIIKHFKNVVALAPTHSATEHIKGQTYQSVFKFETTKTVKDVRRLDKFNITRLMKKYKCSTSQAEQYYWGEQRDLILEADLIVIDEISLLNSVKLNMIFERLKKWLGDKPFPPILLVGDLYQIPPVDPESDSIRYIFQSKHWNFKIIELGTIKRTSDKDFIEILQMFRKGRRTRRLIEWAENHKYIEANRLKHATDLCARKDTVKQICFSNIEKLDSNKKVYKAKAIRLESYVSDSMRNDYINKEFSGELTLTLKIGASVMFCANVKGQYYNGEMGIIRSMDTNEIIVEKFDMQGKSKGKVLVTRFLFTKKDYKSKTPKPIIEINQFPLILSYAVTMHKIQGATLTNPLVIHCDDIWNNAEGLLYTAISRATSPDNVFLKGFTKSMVYPRNILNKFFQEQMDMGNIEVITDY